MLSQSCLNLGMILIASAPAYADTIRVCWDGSGEFVTIQEGIDAAGDGDEVVLCDGTYTGDGNRDIVFRGRAVTVRSENGPEQCVIDCEGDASDPHRGFYLQDQGDVGIVLRGLTIRNGYMSAGGGISCYNSNPTIVDCSIVENTASHRGGGIFCDSSRPTIVDCTINGNAADNYAGGGIFCSDGSDPVISRCSIVSNSADIGGGIICFRNSSPTMVDCLVADNTATAGAGILCDEDCNPQIQRCTITGNTSVTGSGAGIHLLVRSSPTITDCLIADNVAGYYGVGGGIACGGGCDPEITRCVITGNRADFGGGVHGGMDSDPTITDCLIANNVVAYRGGGVQFTGTGGGTVMNCLITGNSAYVGGGICTGASARPTFVNCTITRNTAQLEGGGLYCYRDTVPTFANCILWDDSPEEIHILSGAPVITYSTVEGGYVGEGNISEDPMFGDPDIGDFQLIQGSPCIDAADNEAVPDGVTQDLVGNPRFVDDRDTDDTGNGERPIVDMGAFEFQIGGCTRSERMKRVTCRRPGGDTVVKVVLRRGNPGETFRVQISDGSVNGGTLDDRGRGKVRFRLRGSRSGVVTAYWGSGASANREFSCA